MPFILMKTIWKDRQVRNKGQACWSKVLLVIPRVIHYLLLVVESSLIWIGTCHYIVVYVT